jgi:predicted GNAT family N-acyltransferase
MHVQITDNYEDAQKIREEVFQKEQCVLATLDFDGEDDNSFHFVAYNDDNEPIGTARVRLFDKGKTAKIERLAVLPEYRKSGVGRAIMESIDEYLQNRHIEKAYMHAQKLVKEFHKKFGFFEVGEEFNEADIPHVRMEKKYS